MYVRTGQVPSRVLAPGYVNDVSCVLPRIMLKNVVSSAKARYVYI